MSSGSLERPDAGSGSGVLKQQSDWDRKLNTLDKQEREVHHTQLKIIREQTTAFVRDLTNIRHEVANLKVSMDIIKSGLDRERQERGDSMSQLERKHNNLLDKFENAMPTLTNKLKDQLQAAERQLRDEMLKEITTRKSESESLTMRLTAEAVSREHNQRAFHEQLSMLEGKLQVSEKTLGDKLAASEANSYQQLEVVAGATKHLEGLFCDSEESARQARNEYQQQVEISHGQLKNLLVDLTERVDQHDGRHANSESLLAELTDVLRESQGRLDVLHGRHESLEGLHAEMSDSLKEQQGRHGGLEGLHSAMAEKLDELHGQHGKLEGLHAELLGSLKEQHGRHSSLESSLKNRLDELHGQHGSLEGLHAELANALKEQQGRHGDLEGMHSVLSERLDELHGRHGSLEGMHAELAGALEKQHGLNGDFDDKHSALCKSLDKLQTQHGQLEAMHTQLADRHAEHQGRHSNLEGQHAQLASILQEHQGRHEDLEAGVEGLRSSHGSLVDHVQQTIDDHRTLAEQQGALVKGLEQMQHDHPKILDAHRSEFHGRLDELERSCKDLHAAGQSRVTELQEATRNEFSDYQQQQRTQSRKWEAHHVSIEERLDNLDNILNEYKEDLEKHSRDLEATHTRLGDLHMAQAALGRHKDALSKSSTLCSERLSGVEHALGTVYAPWIVGGGSNQVTRSSHGVTSLGVDPVDAVPEDGGIPSGRSALVQPVHDRLDELERYAAASSSHQSRLQERVDCLEGVLTEEHGRLWQALDNHTHDLSSQVVTRSASPLVAPHTLSKVVVVSNSRDSSPTRPPSSPQASLPMRPMSGTLPVCAAPCPQGATQPGRASPCAVLSASHLPASNGGSLRAAVSPVRSPAQSIKSEPSAIARAASCPTCGNTYAADAVFCRHCGLKRDQAPTVQPVVCQVTPGVAVRSPSPLQGRPPMQQGLRQPFPWPAPAQPLVTGGLRNGSSFGSVTEEVERIACGRAKYPPEASSLAEVPKT